MRFSQATIAAFVAATAEARHFAVLRHNGKGLNSRMDPIINPGKPSGHVHNIFGGNAFKMDMTNDDPLTSTCTTAKINHDFSNYWTPALYFKDPNTGELESVEMFYMNIYYFFEDDNEPVYAFPKGLRIFVGDPNLRTPPYTPNNVLDEGRGKAQPIQWTCPRSNNNAPLYPANSNGLNGVGMQDTGNKGAGVGFPDQECDGYASPLRADIHLPHCYVEGVDVRDYKNNMKWPVNNRCPPGTLNVPHMFYEVYWDTLKFQNRWTKGQGKSPWVLSNGDETGYSLHADFIDGWVPETLQKIIDTCDAGSAGMDKCPIIPGGVNNNDNCKLVDQVGETVFGKMSKLPGANALTGWGKDVGGGAPAPGPVVSAPSNAPSNAPVASSTRAAASSSSSAAAAPPAASSTRPAVNLPVRPVVPSGRPSTTLQAVPTSKPAPAVTGGPVAQPPKGGEVVVTSLVSETTIVYTTLTLPAPGPSGAPVKPASISGYKYKGCFSDKVSARVLTGITFANVGHQQVTNTKCVDYCAARGFSMAGTEFGGQCFCGNALSGSQKIADSKCAMKCEGDGKEICGGPDALSVFEKSSSKRRHLHRHAAHARS